MSAGTGVRRSLAALAIYALVIALANLVLGRWMSMREPAAGGRDVVSAWRQGIRVARKLATGDPGVGLAPELATPGTTLVLERVGREGRVPALQRRLFGWSFVAGRDGVGATLDGRDAVLTPDDLLAARLYRNLGVDADGVLDRLSRELGCTRDALWSRGWFRRFTSARVVLAAPADSPARDPIAGVTAPTGARLTLAIRDAARHLSGRVSNDGRFVVSLDAATGEPRPGYDWNVHAEAVRFLAEMGQHFNDVEVKIAAQRTGWLLRESALSRCGPHACVGDTDRADTGSSATAALALSELAMDRVGLSFREPTRALGAFLRAQQRPDGGFFASYDRVRQRPIGEERGDVDAGAVLALARAHRITRDPADLEAAKRGLDHLVSHPGRLGLRDTLTADPRICLAADALGPGAAATLGFCLEWGSSLRQLDAAGPVPEYAGGFSAGLDWMPDLRSSAARTEGAIATLEAGLRAGRSSRSLTPLGAGVTRSLEFLLREQLPGVRPYLLRAPAAVAGGFTTSPIDGDAGVDFTAAAGSAMLRYLRLLESRGLPPPPPRRARSVGGGLTERSSSR